MRFYVRFNPDKAIFATLAADLADNHKDTIFTYANQAALRYFSPKLAGMKVIDLLEELLGSSHLAHEKFAELFSKGKIIVEGKIFGKYVQYHSIVEIENKFLQAGIFDTTNNRHAQEGFEYTASALARAAEANDEDTGNHIIRINHYAGKLAEMLNLNSEFIKSMYILSQLHDVGKIHVDQNILTKPGRLTKEEFDAMKEHTLYGAKIIGDHERLALARQIALGHHERWDGTGYPHGLSGHMIPLSARIVGIVDIFDALVSERCYKPAFSYEKTFEIMSKGDDRLDPSSHFDPELRQLFLDNYKTFTNIHSQLNE